MNQSPHPKNQRGELGKPLFNWYRNTVSKDPLTRVSAPNHFADRRHFLTNVINRSSNGKVNPQKVAVDDPAAMARHIKAVALYMGADVVGIAKAHPSYLYAGGGRYVQDGTAKDASKATRLKIWRGSFPISSRQPPRGITTSSRRTAIRSATPRTTCRK